MDAIEISGGKPLHGEVQVSGSKNATLPQIAAALLAPGTSVFRGVPDLADIRTLARLLANMGVKVERSGSDLHLDASAVANPVAPYELVKTMRASVLVLGPLVARFGRARVSMPGGCAIGARPIDQHLKGLQLLGAHIDLAHGYVEARAERLRGNRILFDLPTVTGTENLMMAATLAEGRTELENCAREPEVVALAAALNAMGARVQGAGSSVITVDGVTRLRPMNLMVIPDRIEAGTLLMAALVTGGDVLVRGARAQDLDAALAKMREAGAKIDEAPGGLRVVAPARPQAVDFITAPFPGFPTDLQAQMMACLAVAKGASRVVETVFENRFMHVQELDRMGADIAIDGHTAVVRGVAKLSGAEVMATDLRASASLVLAGLRAEGTTFVHRVYHLDRGYESLEKKLAALGASIRRVKGASA
ncbi:MAG TPA: UDP-N-acetylglucosamine 1-carboxyvinyltransferase [Myxococcales bacterium]|nr:UDP-N-acetylglucosamine 1-carboxyvinyltransferase [Myxococcales bacterium]